jgi:sugar phosphate permease
MSVYELDWIAGGGPPTVRLLSGAMGAEQIGIMVAWITVIHQVGGAAAYLGGALRSGSGTYFKAFMMAGLMCIGAALIVLFIGAGRARHEKQTAALPAE